MDETDSDGRVGFTEVTSDLDGCVIEVEDVIALTFSGSGKEREKIKYSL